MEQMDLSLRGTGCAPPAAIGYTQAQKRKRTSANCPQAKRAKDAARREFVPDAEFPIDSDSTVENCIVWRASNPRSNAIGLLITEQPEKTVRSRYESEGKRAPMQGLTQGTFPSIKLVGYNGRVRIVAYLSTPTGRIHPNILIRSTDPDDTSVDVPLPKGVEGVGLVCEGDSPSATFSNMTVRRLRKKDEQKRVTNNNSDVSPNDDACITFMAFRPGSSTPIAVSRTESFACVVQDEPAKIRRVFPAKGCVSGFEAVIVGSLMKAGFAVKVRVGDWQADCEVDRRDSNQNAAIFKFPAYKDQAITEPVDAEVMVVTGPQRCKLTSTPARFQYLPLQSTGGSSQPGSVYSSQPASPPSSSTSPSQSMVPTSTTDASFSNLQSWDEVLPGVQNFTDEEFYRAFNSATKSQTASGNNSLLADLGFTSTQLGSQQPLPSISSSLGASSSDIPMSLPSSVGMLSFEPATPDSGINALTPASYAQQPPSTPGSLYFPPPTPDSLSWDQSSSNLQQQQSKLGLVDSPSSSATASGSFDASCLNQVGFASSSMLAQATPELVYPTSDNSERSLLPLPTVSPNTAHIESLRTQLNKTTEAWETIAFEVRHLVRENPGDKTCKLLQVMVNHRDESLWEMYSKACTSSHDAQLVLRSQLRLAVSKTKEGNFDYSC